MKFFLKPLRYFFLILLLSNIILPSDLCSQSKVQKKFLAKISDLSTKELSNLIRIKIEIDNVVDKRTAYAYVSLEEFERLKKSGYQITFIRDYAKEYSDSLWQATKNSSNPLDEYHTFSELTAELQQFGQDYPDIFQLQSAGYSVLNRNLWIVKISDNVSTEEPEPEFKYISTMHGNEPVGMEMCLYFMRYLLENYGTNPRTTKIVDENETWIMPLMNPDGYVARSRRNHHGVDLNRDFPDRISDPYNTTHGREPETKAIMNFCALHSFVLSANFHTGALVANYPYDSNESGYSTYTACPDDNLFIELAKEYSYYNPPMWNTPQFTDGITNGADWYVIYGGMQDWNYVWMGCNDITVELSDNKWPAASLLPSLWEDNRESMLKYLEAVNWGVRGLVTDSLTGHPLAATIEVAGIDHKIFTDPDVGDYYRLLLSGTYNLSFSADGYLTKEIQSVSVIDNQSTILDVQLVPITNFIVQGTLYDCISEEPVKAIIEFSGTSFFSTESDSLSGEFQIELPKDYYSITLKNDRYVQITDSVNIFENTDIHYRLQPYTFVFETSLEIDNGGFTNNDSTWQWGAPTFGPSEACSGENVWGTNLGGIYPNQINASLATPEICVPNADTIFFTFKQWLEAETDLFFENTAYDGGIVEISTDGGFQWNQVLPTNDYHFVIPAHIQASPFQPGTHVFSGNQDWAEQVLDLEPYRGQNIHIRFRFGSDNDNDYPFAGWYIDDINVKYVDRSTNIKPIDLKNYQHDYFLLKNYPNPFNSSTQIKYSIPLDGKVNISVYNISGQLITTLVNRHHQTGQYQIIWEGLDSNRNSVASGVYFIGIEHNSRMQIKKAILLQ